MYPRLAALALFATVSSPLAASEVRLPDQSRPPAQARETTPPAGAIWGVVVSTTSGQTVDRVRLRLSGDGIRGSRTVYSDEDGRFVFPDLGPGAYTLSGSKTGYVDITYGQSSPNAGRAGTPIQLAEGEQIMDLTFGLPPGGVITGIVFDERSRPSIGTQIRVMRWEYDEGHRELSSESTVRTDDRGMYRVYGLPPGQYVVSASPRDPGTPQAIELEALVADRQADLTGGGISLLGNVIVETPEAPEPAPNDDGPAIGYAPAYYPGTLDIVNASLVKVGVSQEVTGVDFLLQQVPLARVEGSVVAPPGVNARSMRVRLHDAAREVPGVRTESSRVRNGGFSFDGIPPGQYRAVVTAEIELDELDATSPLPQLIGGRATSGAAGDEDELLLWAAADVSVAGADVTGVTLVLQPGLTVSGRIAYAGSGPPPSSRRIRVSVEPFGPAAEAAGADGRRATVNDDGTFIIAGVIPAMYRVGASGVSGWHVASAQIDGVDAMDLGLDVTGAQDLSGLEVVFSDIESRLAGTLHDAAGRPTGGFTVVLFPAESRYWLPEARRIQAVRPSTAGQYAFEGLPAGDYRLAAVTDVEEGIWYDPVFLRELAAASIPLTLQPGQSLAQDLRIGG